MIQQLTSSQRFWFALDNQHDETAVLREFGPC